MKNGSKTSTVVRRGKRDFSAQSFLCQNVCSMNAFSGR